MSLDWFAAVARLGLGSASFLPQLEKMTKPPPDCTVLQLLENPES